MPAVPSAWVELTDTEGGVLCVLCECVHCPGCVEERTSFFKCCVEIRIAEIRIAEIRIAEIRIAARMHAALENVGGRRRRASL